MPNNLNNFLDDVFDNKPVNQQKEKIKQQYKQSRKKQVTFNKEEIKLITTTIRTFIRSYKGNIKKAIDRGSDPRDCKNYLEIIEALTLYEKITNHEYHDKELLEMLRLKSKENNRVDENNEYIKRTL